MRLITIITSLIIVTGCNSTKPLNQDQKITNIMNKVELAKIKDHGFCEAVGLYKYMETKLYYSWKCKDGSSFMISKE